MHENKYVTWRHLKPGMKIEGYKQGNRFTYSASTVVAANAAFVDLMVFDKEPKRLNSEDVMFEVEMTEEEFQTKYRKGAAQVIQGILNKITEDQAGGHEMWNSWISYDPYEIAAECAKHEFKVIGHIELSVPKKAMFSGELLEIGICCEYADGNRFWCHASKDYLVRFKERYPDLLSMNLSETT